MLNLIKKDFIITYSNKTIFLAFLFFVPILFFLKDTLNSNMVFLYSVLPICFLSTRSSFSYDSMRKSEFLIQSLPVTKRDIVVSKYLSIFINFTIACIFTISYMFVLNNATPISIDLSNLRFNSIVSGLVLVILYVSLSMPGEFGFTPKTSSILNTIIYVTFLNLFMMGDSPILDFPNIFSDYKLATGLIVILIYLVSMKVSILLYKNRKFY